MHTYANNAGTPGKKFVLKLPHISGLCSDVQAVQASFGAKSLDTQAPCSW